MRRKVSVEFVAVSLMLLFMVTHAMAQEKLYRKGPYFIGEITKTLSAGRAGILDIRNKKGDITVKGWDQPRVRIQQKVKMDVITKSEAQKGFELVKNSLHVSGKRILVDGQDFRSWMRVDFVVMVPRAFNVNLRTSGGDLILTRLKGSEELTTSGGDIEIRHAEGQIQARTSGGDILVREAKGTLALATSGGDLELSAITGVLSASTSGGDIRLKNCGDRIAVATSGGDIQIVNTRGYMNARTSGGNIDVRDANGPLHITTSGGDIQAVRVSGNVTAKTSGGDIGIEDVLKRATAITSGGDISLMNIGDAVVAKTSGGDIDIKNAGSSVNAVTSGGNISVNMNPRNFKTDHHAKIISSGGDLELSLPAKLPASIHAVIRIEHKLLQSYSITSDFPLQIQKRDEKGWIKLIEATGDINGGGDKIELKTVNGNIVIKKR
ncbi:MAG: DUF4097 domain-containing protein [Calditrichaeota bacterium]|nr:DUF4097 domain-containing protein [Calditrichota bacterium]